MKLIIHYLNERVVNTNQLVKYLLYGNMPVNQSEYWLSKFFEGLYFSKKNYTLKFQNQIKDDEISHERGNSLRSKVRVFG